MQSFYHIDKQCKRKMNMKRSKVQVIEGKLQIRQFLEKKFQGSEIQVYLNFEFGV